MRVLLAYGSAMSRIDDMKLLGGISGGRTSREILDSIRWNLQAPLEWGDEKGPFPEILPADSEVHILTNPWLAREPQHARENAAWYAFRTWEEYRDLLYTQCEQWQPHIVLCAPAVSNFTPSYVVQTGAVEGADPLASSPRVRGKIDTRKYTRLLVEFEKTPNIIGGVRERIGRNAVLVGFKLTSHGDVGALVEHAQQVLVEAQCDFVVANDLKLGLGRKFFVTPTGWVEKEARDIFPFAWNNILKPKVGGFYHTNIEFPSPTKKQGPWDLAEALYQHLLPRFSPGTGKQGEEILHGCLAVRHGKGFITTQRGKTPDGGSQLTFSYVDHDQRMVHTAGAKATLNAPLLDKLFQEHPEVQVIVHLHQYLKGGVPTFPYTLPGTLSEAILADGRLGGVRAFNIEAHGSIASFTTSDVDEIMAWMDDPENWVPQGPREYRCESCGGILVTMEDCERHVALGCGRKRGGFFGGP